MQGIEPQAIEGVGLGLRSRHYADLMAPDCRVPWLEVLADNYAHADGLPIRHLERISERYPLVFHAVGMSLGSAAPLDNDYLAAIGDLARRFRPAWISDHLAWTSLAGRHHHDLLPLPYNAESVATVAAHIREVQDRIGGRMLVENAASYLAFEASDLEEVEFVCAVLEEADCLLLLDVNNVYVNAQNQGFSAENYLKNIPCGRVKQMHLAGYEDHGRYLVDAHGSPVASGVWELYQKAARLFPNVPVCVEWDQDIPDFAVLEKERRHAEEVSMKALPTSSPTATGMHQNAP